MPSGSLHAVEELFHLLSGYAVHREPGLRGLRKVVADDRGRIKRVRSVLMQCEGLGDDSVCRQPNLLRKEADRESVDVQKIPFEHELPAPVARLSQAQLHLALTQQTARKREPGLAAFRDREPDAGIPKSDSDQLKVLEGCGETPLDRVRFVPQPDRHHQVVVRVGRLSKDNGGSEREVREGVRGALGGDGCAAHGADDGRLRAGNIDGQIDDPAVVYGDAGVAHNFNNLLTGVMGYAGLMKMRSDIPDPVASNAQKIVESARRCSAIVRRIQTFRRPIDPTQTETVDLNQVVRDTIDITHAKWKTQAERDGKRIVIDMDLQGDMPGIQAVCSAWEEILSNLIFNAVDAMPEGECSSHSSQRSLTIEGRGWV